MDGPQRDVFYKDFIISTGERVECIDGIGVTTTVETGVSELPDYDLSLRDSDRAFFRFFEAHGDRAQEVKDLGDIYLEEYKAY